MLKGEVAACEIGNGDNTLDAPLELTDDPQRFVCQPNGDLVARCALGGQGEILKGHTQPRVAHDQPNGVLGDRQQHKQVCSCEVTDAAAAVAVHQESLYRQLVKNHRQLLAFYEHHRLGLAQMRHDEGVQPVLLTP